MLNHGPLCLPVLVKLPLLSALPISTPLFPILLEWQNCWGWKCPLDHLVKLLCPGSVTWSRLHRHASRWVLNISRAGDSTTFLGSLWAPLPPHIFLQQKTPNKSTTKPSDLCRSFGPCCLSLTNSPGREMLKSGICILGQLASEIKPQQIILSAKAALSNQWAGKKVHSTHSRCSSVMAHPLQISQNYRIAHIGRNFKTLSGTISFMEKEPRWDYLAPCPTASQKPPVMKTLQQPVKGSSREWSFLT